MVNVILCTFLYNPYAHMSVHAVYCINDEGFINQTHFYESLAYTVVSTIFHFVTKAQTNYDFVKKSDKVTVY